MLETTTPSIFDPSTDSMAIPDLARSPGQRYIVQLLTAMFLKSPLLSVPILKLFDALVSTQFVTATSSVETRLPSARLAFMLMASSRDSKNQLVMRNTLAKTG